jgi:ubiquitin C-terminal hydrolase
MISLIVQALAHAPEICFALDLSNHSETCPTAAANRRRAEVMAESQPAEGGASNVSSRATSPLDETSISVEQENITPPPLEEVEEKPRPVLSSSLTVDSLATTATVKARAGNRRSRKEDDGWGFCALCEFEAHMRRVHDYTATGPSRPSSPSGADVAALNVSSRPVAPTTFVRGFIRHVAPSFRLGVQEDSHEFLRLLIDAMQKSCRKARSLVAPSADDAENQGSRKVAKKPKGIEPEDESEDSDAEDDSQDPEYPFALFRGAVESTVTCKECQAQSSTHDPIEDLGLEVLYPTTAMASSNGAGVGTGRPTLSNSPVPVATSLASVQAALTKFARAEKLDAGYKCENCGKLGSATKESRLARIPPILTLHLKRFRYGSSTPGGNGVGGSVNGGGGFFDGPTFATSTRSSTRSAAFAAAADTGPAANEAPLRRSGRLASSGPTPLVAGGTANSGSEASTSGDFFLGKSGSAKIEGHIKFEQVVNLRPYLTENLQKRHKQMFCRLFAVVVHSGKNSHSGHYIAFVRSLSRNEWWRMDDGRVNHATEREVMAAEAYMLFYRVFRHPVAAALQEKHNALVASRKRDRQFALQDLEQETQRKREEPAAQSVFKRGPDAHIEDAEPKKPKVISSCFKDGEEWARKATGIPPAMMILIRQVESLLSAECQLSPASVQSVSDAAVAAVASMSSSSSGGASSPPGPLDSYPTFTGTFSFSLLGIPTVAFFAHSLISIACPGKMLDDDLRNCSADYLREKLQVCFLWALFACSQTSIII